MPELKAAVVQGELSISKARRITSVITPANHQEWIKNAQTMKQKELEKAVSIVNPQAHPIERIKPLARNISELRVPIDDETDKNLEILKELLSQKLKRPATLADVIAWAAKETREKFDPEKKAERSVKRVSSLQLTDPTQRYRNRKGLTRGPYSFLTQIKEVEYGVPSVNP